METFLAIIHIIACFGLIGLILIQDSKGGGVFTSQSSSNSVLGAGGATSLAQTMTKIMAGLFAVTCIGLSIVSARSEKSVIDTMPAAVTAPSVTPSAAVAPPTTADSAPTAPAVTQPTTNEKK